MTATEPAPGIWGTLARRVESAPSGGEVDVWQRLAVLVDPLEFRPKLAPDVEVKEFKLRWGNDYAMIANPRDLIHYRLEPGETDLLTLMDGTRTVKEIVVEQLRESGDLEVSGVVDLIRQMNEGSFLDPPFESVEMAVRHAMDDTSPARRKVREFVKTLSIDWTGADGLVRWLYDNGLKRFFTRWAQIPGALVAVLGFVAFLAVERAGRFSLGGRSVAIATLVLLALNYLLTFLHELGHAVTLIHYGRRVKSAGFMIYFGSPAFFVESSDALMMDRGQRVVQSFAGPYAEAIVAGTAAIVLWAYPHGAIASILYKFVVLNYFVLFLNLVPLLELDGYWILSDLIQVPELRPMSLTFIQHDLWHKLKGRERLSKQEIGLGLYGFVGVAFTIFSFYTAFFFWHEVFGGLVGQAWDGGPVTRVLLVAVGLFVAGPLIRGFIGLARSAARRIRSVLRRIRFRLEIGWRVEAARLLDALPMFHDLPEDVLNDLAGRTRLRSFPASRAVVRQGERADAFYVVRKGTLQVVEESAASGNERVLRILGRGEAFGELGLLESAPRAATVRAIEDAEVFEVDKGSFDRLLADMIDVPEFGPTMQAVAELRELAAFQHLEPDELAHLLEHGRWVNVGPGVTLMEEGQPGDAFYVIRSGQVGVIRDGDLIRTLRPGEYFGEVALLLDVPRTATILTRTPVRAFRLDREGFDRLVRGAFARGSLKPQADRTWQH